jgi:hypothetical protein
MNRLRIIGLALVAVVALSALATATASAALPEFVPTAGKFPVKFTDTSGAGTLETVGGHKVTCKADSSTGEFTGAKTNKETFIFTGCESLGFKCNSAGAAAGEIRTNAIASLLVYINKAKKEVGMDLSPEVVGGLFAEFSCGGVETLKVRGSVIAPVTKVNTAKQASFKLTAKASKGVQKPTEYENEAGKKVKDILETEGAGALPFAFEQSGITTTDTIKLTKETGEIKG